MIRRAVLAAGTVAGVLVPASGASADAPTPRWARTGPPPGLVTPYAIGAAGDTVAVLHVDTDRIDATTDVRPTGVLVRGPLGTFTGRLVPARSYGAPLVAGPGTVIVPMRLDGSHATAAQRTTDGGRTWSRIAPPRCEGVDPSWTGGAFAPDGTGLALGWDGGQGECVWRTTDRGATWRIAATSPGLSDVAYVGDGRYVGVARPVSGSDLEGSALVSDDGGRSWDPVAVPAVPALDPEPGTPPDPAGPAAASRSAGGLLSDGRGHVLIGTTSGAVLESKDGARTFVRREVERPTPYGRAPQTDATVTPRLLRPDGSALVDVASRSSSDRRLLDLRDGAYSVAAPLLSSEDVATSTATSVYRLGRSAGRTALTRDTGPSSVELAGGRTAPGDLGRGRLAAFVRDGRLWRSTDGGARWTTTALPEGLRIAAVARDAGGDVVLDASGALHRLRATGALRPIRGASGLRARDLAVAQGQVVVVGTGGAGRVVGERVRRAPGAFTRRPWTRAAGSGVQAVATDETGHVLRSTDGGRTWRSAARLRTSRAGRIRAVGVGPSKTIVLVSALRLWSSRNGGRTFRRGPRLRRAGDAWSGRPARIVMRDDRHGAIAAYGRLVGTSDGGRSVRRIALPSDAGPDTVSDGGGGRLLVQDDLSGDLLRSSPLR
jgi:photosystem II stability/assembly factor-like uncharacterized protein